MTTRIEGFDEVRQAVQRLPDAALTQVSTVIAQTAFAAKQRAVALAPRDTGRLRAAITSNSRGLFGRVVISDPLAYYWRFVEYGTVNMPARPFIRTAAELETSDFVERVRQVGKRLERDFASGGGLL